MRPLLFLFLFFCFLPPVFAQGRAELEKFLGDGNSFFAVDRPRFITIENQYYFRWADENKTQARYPAWNGYCLTFCGFPVQEAVVFFRENQVERLYVSVYNRGDAGELPPEKMAEIIRKLDAFLIRKTGVKEPESSQDKLGKGIRVWSRKRTSGKFVWILKWGFSGRTKREMKSEYVQVEIQRAVERDPNELPPSWTSSRKPAPDLLKNVRQDRNGVWIDNIPMVDQGRKGYCAAAVTERVLRYYGNDVTQHVIAQLAGTSAQNGTSVESLLEILKKAAVRFSIRVKDLYAFVRAPEDLERFLQKYNKQARKEKKEPAKMIVRGNTVYISETIGQMDPAVYVKARTSDKGGLRNFEAQVKNRIRKGIPLVWGVSLGIVPEESVSPQTKGGHLRLIIGFNENTREILYSDTWGRGHERKSMPMENAWAITDHLIAVDPR